jgi:hypothetical protein
MPRHVITSAQVTLNGVVAGRARQEAHHPDREALAGQRQRDVRRLGREHPRRHQELEGQLRVLPGLHHRQRLVGHAGHLHATGSSGVALIVRPTTGIRTSDNPEWQGQILLDGEFPQIDAEFGGVNMAPVNFLGTGALSFLTSSS